MSRQRRKREALAEQMQMLIPLYSEETHKATVASAARDIGDKDVTYASLEAAIESLELPKSNPDNGYDLSIHDTKKKLDVNLLGEPTIRQIQEAAQHSATVEQFISDRAKLTNDSDFPYKLRGFFLDAYNTAIREKGIFGDALFADIRQAISERMTTASGKFAIQAILVHLFIICDVFRRPEEELHAAS